MLRPLLCPVILLTPLVVNAADAKTQPDAQGPTCTIAVYGSFIELDEEESGFVIKRLPEDDATRELRLYITFEGEATPGADYVIPTVPRSIKVGQREVTIPITIVDDDEGEGKETILISVVGVPTEPGPPPPLPTTRPATQPVEAYQP